MNAMNKSYDSLGDGERQPLLGSMSCNRQEIKTKDESSELAPDCPSSEDSSPDAMKESQPNSSTTFVRKVLANMTIEPMLFLKMMAEGNMKILADTLEIDRVCRVNLNYSAADCQVMDDGNHTEIQNAVQKYQNIFNYHQNLMDSIIPLLVILFVGPLSDRLGRKLAMVCVLAGFIGFSLVYILTALNSSWPVQMLYLATLCVDMSGSWVVFNMAVYSYIADITSVESRTKRMGIADAIWYLGSPIGTLLGGFVFKTFGYVAVYTISCALWVLCLLYTLFFVKESRRGIEEDDLRCGMFGYVISLFRTVFRRRPENGRFHILILIFVKLGVFLVQGHQTYLWARKILQWDATTFSTWSSLEEASHQAGMVGWVWVGERLALHDCTIANGGLFSILLWSVTLANITGPSFWWLTIVASFLGLLEASIEPAIRSMLTVIAGIGEEGRVLSMLGIFESAWLSADRAIYTYLYNTFINIFPQINFVVQAGIAAFLMLVVFLLKRSLHAGRQPEELTTPAACQHPHDT